MLGMETPNSVPESDQNGVKDSGFNTTLGVIKAVSKFQTRHQRMRRGSQWSTANMDSFIARYTTQRTCAIIPKSDDDVDDEGRSDELDSLSPDVERGSDDTMVVDSCRHFVFDPDGNLIFYWLLLVTIAVIYNLWLPLNRFAWRGFDRLCRELWITLDCCFDVVYFADIFVQSRTAYMEHGLLVEDVKRLAVHYFKSAYFFADLISILPTNLIYLIFVSSGVSPILRFPRILKIYRARQFAFKVEAASSHPNLFRILNFIHLLLLVNHLVATGYCLLMRSLNMTTNENDGNDVMSNMTTDANSSTMVLEYVKGVYWSTVTLTAIGDVPNPEYVEQYVLQILGYFFGIFVFATIVGQVGTIVNQRNMKRLEFESIVDNAKKYMREHEVPKEVQKSILGWFQYAWARGKSVKKDADCFEMLPTKLRTELAIHVNLETLKKVSFFQECEPEFLHDLVLRMQLVVTTPGELVCRKGEIAREMFIISDGVLEVLNDDDTVIRTLQAGDFFGETGLLVTGNGGSNRRTADVRSLGYSDLFVVTKEDALSLLDDYPETKKALEDRANFYMTQDELKRKESSSLHRNDTARDLKKQTSVSYRDRMGRSLTLHRSAKLSVRTLPDRCDPASFDSISFRRRLNRRGLSGEKSQDEEENNGGKLKVDVAREVMTSIEDVLFNKLSKVSKDYNRLYSRLQQMEKELQRKTEELERYRQKYEVSATL